MGVEHLASTHMPSSEYRTNRAGRRVQDVLTITEEFRLILGENTDAVVVNAHGSDDEDMEELMALKLQANVGCSQNRQVAFYAPKYRTLLELIVQEFELDERRNERDESMVDSIYRHIYKHRSCRVQLRLASSAWHPLQEITSISSSLR